MSKLASSLLISLGLLAGARVDAVSEAPAVPDFPRVPPTEPAKAVEAFRTLDGFRMDLLAAEPLVTDPVALAYDEDGRAYVAEMNDYPYTDAATHEAWKDNTTDAPIGRVRLLVDTDGDGDFDRSTVFADGLSWPTGVACYKGGVFVAATPDVWYLKDTDGDGKADVKRKVFTGFRKYNVQAVMNNLQWGLDNRLYGAGGSNGGKVIPGDKPDAEPVAFSRNDFRFDPATERFELIPGGARFGNAFDDWGNRFVCNIRNPAQHVVIESRYLARNPHVAVPSVVHDVARSGDALPVYRISPVEAWRDHRANRLAAERAKQPRSELVAGGVVTSASGVTVYRGDAYPPEFREMFFLGEVANNLIHRQVLRPDGVTFRSGRKDANVEFVASPDVWFRPVNFVNAPDGTLHVLDMYREVIEHPWSIPDDIRAKLDLRSGADRGRIYRLAPMAFAAPKPPRLSGTSAGELVALLAGRNAWHRETAQRLIVERQDKAAIEPLRQLARTSKEPLARLHALWTLEGLDATNEADVLQGMRDAAPGVRASAILVAERHLARFGGLKPAVLRAANDDDVRVRFQAALTLGELGGDGDADDNEAVELALAQLLRRDAGDRWMQTAVLSSSHGRAMGVLAGASGDADFATSPGGREAVRQLALVVGVRGDASELTEVATLIEHAPDVRPTLLLGLGEGLRRGGSTLRRADRPAIDAALAEAAGIAGDAGASPAERERAVRVLGFDDLARTKDLLARLLDPRQPPEVQRAAVAALAANNAPEVGPVLLSRWRSYTPAVKADVMTALLAYANRLPALLDALEAGTVSPHDVPAARRPALLAHADESVRTRAAKLLGAGEAAQGRKEVLDRFAAALQLTGDAASGRKVYEVNCAACHKLGDLGHDVGPNLATVRQWGPEQLLVNILDPNREVGPGFAEYVVQLADGETLSGVVAEENVTSLTLKLTGGTQRVLPRGSVKRIAASKLSLMPEGLEAAITPQQMADLIRFLKEAP